MTQGLFDVATQLAASQMPTAAAEVLERLLQVEPGHIAAWKLLAETTPQFSRRAACWERLCELEPDVVRWRELKLALKAAPTVAPTAIPVVAATLQKPPRNLFPLLWHTSKWLAILVLLGVTAVAVAQAVNAEINYTYGVHVDYFSRWPLSLLAGRARPAPPKPLTLEELAEQQKVIQTEVKSLRTQMQQSAERLQLSMAAVERLAQQQLQSDQALQNTIVQWQRSSMDASGSRSQATVANSPQAAVVQGVDQLPARKAEPQPEFPEHTTQLPSPILQLLPVDHGRTVLVCFKSLAACAVYNTAERKVIRMIPLREDPAFYAAGGDILLTYEKETNLLTTYQISTGERLLSRMNPAGEEIQCLTMGHLNGEETLVKAKWANGVRNYIVSTADLTVASEERLDGKSRPWSDGHHRVSQTQRHANGNLTMIVEWGVSGSPSGVTIMNRKANQFEGRYQHDSAGVLFAGDDDRVYGQTGAVYSAEAQVIGKYQGVPLPGLGSGWLLSTYSGRYQIFRSDLASPLAFFGKTLRPPAEPHRHEWNRMAELAVFAPMAESLLLAIPGENKLVSRKFDPREILRASKIDHLFTISAPPREAPAGEEWKYTIDAMSSSPIVRYQLVLGPPGMKLSPEGELRWRVPETGLRQLDVIVEIVNQQELTTFHRFRLNIKESNAPPQVPPAGVQAVTLR